MAKDAASGAAPSYASVPGESKLKRTASGCVTGKPKAIPNGMVRAVCLSTLAFSLSGFDQGVADAAMMSIRLDMARKAMSARAKHEGPAFAENLDPESLVARGVHTHPHRGGPIALFEVSKEQEEFAIGILNIAAAVGALAGGLIADWQGRKGTICFSSAFYVVGAFLMAVSQSYALLLSGRIVMGMGIGVALVVCPIYIAELAPKESRGHLVSMTDFGLDIASVAGFAVAYWCINITNGWRLMMMLGCLPPIFVLVFSRCWLPESPRWLVSRGRDAEAFEALQLMGYSAAEVSSELATFQLTNDNGKEGDATWAEALYPRDAVMRVMMMTGIGVAFFSQATGTEATINYIPEIMRDEAEIRNAQSDLLISMTVASAQVLALLIASFFFDRVGRRPMLMLGASGLVVSFLLAAIAVLADSPFLAIVGVFGVVISFATGFSPLTYVVCAEVFPSRLRAKAMALALFTTRSIAGTISLGYLSLEKGLTPAGLNFLFAAVSLISVVFVAYCVPETMGLELEDVEALFRNRVRERAKLLPSK